MFARILIPFIAGVIIGILLFRIFLKPEVGTVTEYKEVMVTKTDTVIVKEFVTATEIKHRIIRDTVLLDNYKPSIQAFSAVFPFTYGNAYLSGEVLGEVLKTDLQTDFKLPVITNTITKEKNTTRTVIQKGIFLGGGMDNRFDYHVGASYLGNGFLINADYIFNPVPVVQVGVKVKVF